jgi:hypothetical protein
VLIVGTMYACENYVVLMKMRIKDKNTTCVCIIVNLRNISAGVGLWNIKLEIHV